MARWMHDVSSRRLTQEEKGKSPISLKINDPEKKYLTVSTNES